MPLLCSPGCEWLGFLSVFQVHWWCLFSALQKVSGCCAFLYFKPADDACPLLFSGWVAVVPCCVSSLLMMLLLCSPVGEWLLLAVFQASWWCLFSTHQQVSGCCFLLCFKPGDEAFSLLLRMWVAAVPFCVSSESSLLMLLALCSPVGEWLLCHTCLKPANYACPLLSSWWVAAVLSCISSLLMMLVLCSPVGEWLLCLVVFWA